MHLPHKKVIGIAILCAIAIFGTLYFRDSKMLGGKGAFIAVSTNNAPPLKPKAFYQQSIEKATSSMTDSLSRDFFINFADLQNKNSWNVDSQAALIENLSTNYATSSPILLKVSDIAVFSDLDKAKTREFGNNTAKTLLKYTKSLETNPFTVLDEAATTQTGSTTFKKRLNSITESYTLLSKELSNISAPANLAATYTDIINSYFAVGIDVNNMQYYWSDPVRGLLGMTNYQKDLMHVIDLLKNTADYFTSNAILFNNTESGKLWTNISQIQ